jgi:hypothetical protein
MRSSEEYAVLVFKLPIKRAGFRVTYNYRGIFSWTERGRRKAFYFVMQRALERVIVQGVMLRRSDVPVASSGGLTSEKARLDGWRSRQGPSFPI